MGNYNYAQNKDFRETLNSWALYAICLWVALPIFSFWVGQAGLGMFLVVWFITGDFGWIGSKWSEDMKLFFVFMATFLPYIFLGRLGYGQNGPNMIKFVFPLFFSGIFINHYHAYYKKDYVTLGRAAFVSILGSAVGSLQTFIGLLRYSGAARALSAYKSAMTETYRRLGIGGYTYVYGAVLIFVAILFLLRNNRQEIDFKSKFVAWIALAALGLMLMKASYATALLLVFAGIFLVVFAKKKNSFFISVIAFVFLLLLVSLPAFNSLILRFIELFSNNNTIYKRFMSVFYILTGEKDEYSGMQRLELYKNSLRTFLKYPIFGFYGSSRDMYDALSFSVIGRHSSFLDLFAMYGIWSGIPAVAIIITNIKKHLAEFEGQTYSGLVLISGTLFLILNVVNPVITASSIGFVFFLILPSLPYLSLAFQNQGQLLRKEIL